MQLDLAGSVGLVFEKDLATIPGLIDELKAYLGTLGKALNADEAAGATIVEKAMEKIPGD